MNSKNQTRWKMDQEYDYQTLNLSDDEEYNYQISTLSDDENHYQFLNLSDKEYNNRVTSLSSEEYPEESFSQSDEDINSDNDIRYDIDDDIKLDCTNDDDKFDNLEYKSVDIEELDDMRAETIANLSSIIGENYSTTTKLLIENSWNLEEIIESIFEDREEYLIEAGVAEWEIDSESIAPTSNIAAAKASAVFVCNICYDDECSNTFSLSCGHEYCYDCSQQYVKTKIEERSSPSIRCINTSCSIAFDEEDIHRILDENSFEKYHRYINQNFVICTKTLKYCIHKDCEQVIECNIHKDFQLDKILPLVSCQHGHKQCFHCSTEQDHSPLPCKYVQKWSLVANSDLISSRFILDNTKSCPNCRSPIEKNGGCEHMKCLICNYEFCWKCFQNWHGHINCSVSNTSNGFTTQSLEEPRQKLQRQIRYLDRFKHHKESLKSYEEIIKNIETKLGKLYETGTDKIDIQFIKDSIKTLQSCMNTLIWTYPFIYFLPTGTNSTAIFEDSQENLEIAIQNFRELFSTPVIEFKNKDCNLKFIDCGRRLKNLRDNVRNYALDGLRDGSWELNLNN